MHYYHEILHFQSHLRGWGWECCIPITWDYFSKQKKKLKIKHPFLPSPLSLSLLSSIVVIIILFFMLKGDGKYFDRISSCSARLGTENGSDAFAS